MLLDFNGWNYERCKGQAVSYVARGRGKPDRIANSVRTTMAKGNLDRESLERMLGEIESETVRPFFGSPWNQPERLDRFRAIKDGLVGEVTPSGKPREGGSEQ
ncbi:MAG TPA: hypothetical protein VNN77_05370 [candidate division Zixibacteria bacterium]|nr:hypothetical protein [candidate division Zixibacteria bacterium]